VTTASDSVSNKKLLTSELVPEQVLPKVLNTFDGVSILVFVVFAVNSAAVVALGGWGTTPFQFLAVLIFLIPSALGVAELSGAWPAEGGVYVWASKTFPQWTAFFAGFLSWVPVVLNASIQPAVAVSLIELAFPSFKPSTTLTVFLELVFLWVIVGIALVRLRPSRNVANGVFLYYGALVVLVLVGSVIIAARAGHAANPVHPHDFLQLNFALYGSYFGLIMLNFTGVEAAFNMGAETREARRSHVKIVVWGSIIIVLGYLLVTFAILLATPAKNINGATGGIQLLQGLHVPGLVPVVALTLVVITVIVGVTYQQAYCRLMFVSGLERHLPKLFTHLNAKTKNPVPALLFTGALVSVIIVVVYSQASLLNAYLEIEGALTIMWLTSGLFFLLPIPIARRRFRDLYQERFWRIPGGLAGAWAVVVVGIGGIGVGIYYTFVLPFSSSIGKGEWLRTVSAIIGGLLVLAGLIYIFGRRRGRRVTEEALVRELLGKQDG
jgi:glutamate:GABA antiporter